MATLAMTQLPAVALPANPLPKDSPFPKDLSPVAAFTMVLFVVLLTEVTIVVMVAVGVAVGTAAITQD